MIKFNRMLCWLIALMTLFNIIPMFASAEIESLPLEADLSEAEITVAGVTEYSIQSYSYEDYLSTTEAIEAVREHLIARDTTFTVRVCFPCDSISVENIEKVAIALYDAAMEHTGNPVGGDYIKKNITDDDIKVVTNYFSDDGYFYVCFDYTRTYLTTAEQEAAVTAEVEQILRRLDLYNKSDYEKIYCIYNYLTKNIYYDYDGLENDTDLMKFSTYGALVERSCVCQGFASAFYRLMLELDVDCRYIAGTSSSGVGHGWNIVKIGDFYYNLDATWDSEAIQSGSSYSHFLKSENNFSSGHIRDSEYTTAEFQAAYPMAQSNYATGLLHIKGTNMSIGNSLNMNFAIDRRLVDDWEGFYALIVRDTAGGGSEVTTVSVEDWLPAGSYYVIPYENLAAKEITDVFRVTIYNALGQRVSVEHVETAALYARRTLEWEQRKTAAKQNPRLMTTVVDMLYYGDAAQIYFGYNTENLATDLLSEEQKALATPAAAATNKRVKGANCVGTNLRLDNRILMTAAFRGVSPKMTATYSYEDHAGNLIEEKADITIDGSYGYVEVDELNFADVRQVVTIRIFNQDGSEYSSVEESIESYVARSTGNLAVLCDAVMRLGIGAYNYFHT